MVPGLTSHTPLNPIISSVELVTQYQNKKFCPLSGLNK